MAQRKKSAQAPARDDERRSRQEGDAQEIKNLPNREAMSILSGFPSIPGLPTGLLGDQGGLPTPGGAPVTPVEPGPVAPADPGPVTPVDPNASPGDINTIAPSNQTTAENVSSAGTTEMTGATQDTPIIQHG